MGTFFAGVFVGFLLGAAFIFHALMDDVKKGKAIYVEDEEYRASKVSRISAGGQK